MNESNGEKIIPFYNDDIFCMIFAENNRFSEDFFLFVCNYEYLFQTLGHAYYLAESYLIIGFL